MIDMASIDADFRRAKVHMSANWRPYLQLSGLRMIWQCLAEAQLEMRALGRQILENGVREPCTALHKPQKHPEKSQTFSNSIAAPLTVA